MNLNLDWNKDFQEFQDILNCGLHPEWLYNAKANMILVPAYTGEGKQFLELQIFLKQVRLFLSFNIIMLYLSNVVLSLSNSDHVLHCFSILICNFSHKKLP